VELWIPAIQASINLSSLDFGQPCSWDLEFCRCNVHASVFEQAGRVAYWIFWESASGIRAAGVDAKLVDRLELWGAQYMAVSSLFQY
jgi:hypothetical protein